MDGSGETVSENVVLKLLGEGVQWSLDYTMGDYLKATKYADRNSNIED